MIRSWSPLDRFVEKIIAASVLIFHMRKRGATLGKALFDVLDGDQFGEKPRLRTNQSGKAVPKP
jgi:hypothetical protein